LTPCRFVFLHSSPLHLFALPRLVVLALSLAAAMGVSSTGNAKVEIEGIVPALHVRASGDAIADVLAAISTVVDVRYRTSIPLETIISGTYSGSADRVIARLLRDYNFTIVHNGEALVVSVYGNALSATSTPPSSAILTPPPCRRQPSPGWRGKLIPIVTRVTSTFALPQPQRDD
jgi:hypothetical protein